MRQNFKIIVEYDGCRYHGWQRQKNDRTIQGEIEKALKVMTRSEVTLTASGRTDSGVHAMAQTANFMVDTNLSPANFQNGLNSMLDRDIVILECSLVADDFHSRFSAMSKTYNYRIVNQEFPPAIGRQYAWFVRKKLDIEAMGLAAAQLTGTHDFKAFEATGSPRSTTVRTITRAVFFHDPSGWIVFEIQANGFLRYMVRNIVGTLVDVGLQKTTPEDFKAILESKDRSKAGITAPAHGLFLVKVDYG